MTYFEKWQKLKIDMELAVKEGFNEGFNMVPNTSDGGRFIAYRYILDMINELDEL